MKSSGIIGKAIACSMILVVVMSSAIGFVLYLGGTVATSSDILPGLGSFAIPAMLFFIAPIAAVSIAGRLIYLAPLGRIDLSAGGDTSSRLGEEIDKARKRLFRLPVFTFISHAVLFAPILAGFSLLYESLPGAAEWKPVAYAVLGLAASVLHSSVQINLDFRLLTPLFRAFEGYDPDRNVKKVRFGIRFNLNLVFTAAFAFCMLFSLNVVLELRHAERFQASLVEATAQGRMTPSEAAAQSRAAELSAGSVPTGVDTGLVAAWAIIACMALACLFSVTAVIRRRVIAQRSLIENIIHGNDFSKKRAVVVEHDEIGMTSITLNTFIDRFTGILHTIFSSTEAVQNVSGSLDTSLSNASAAIEEMVTSIKQITGSTSTQMKMVKDIRAKLEEMLVGIDGTSFDVVELSNFVQETSGAMNQTTANIQTISHNTEKVNELANRLVDISKNGSFSVNETVSAIKEIEKASAQVGNIVEVISNIATQTNLLSLNASIEAAHAGDKGRGFAVVAGEIRKLAEQSNENIDLISKQIKNMTEKVKTGVELASAADTAFRKIDEDIKLTTQHIGQVTIALQEQNQGSHEIMSSLEEMVNKTVEVKEIAEDLKRMSEEIHQFMDDLYNISTSITEATGEQDKGNREILTLITTVKDASQKNLSVVDDLHTIVNEYKDRQNEEKKLAAAG